MRKIKVLVVDDSAFMRKMLREILSSDPDIEVIDVARNGKEAIEKVNLLSPDVVTMDVEMPVMTGIQAVERIMKQKPTPIIMVSAYTVENASITFEALDRGALDFITKPGGPISIRLKDVKEKIIEKVKAVSHVNVRALKTPLKRGETLKALPGDMEKIVVIASSTGGPKALSYIIPRLPGDLRAGILVVQHMPKGFTKPFAERLDKLSKLTVKEAEEGEKISSSTVYIAPAGYHMKIGEEWIIHLTNDAPMHGVRPAADITMLSAASVSGKRTIGVVLTGMGKDGSMGVREIKTRGGKVIAQDRKTSVIFGMPKAAIDTGCVDEVLPLEDIPEGIVNMVAVK